jgi:hypothetical protein
MARVDYGGAVLPYGTQVPIGAVNYTIASAPEIKDTYTPAEKVYGDSRTFEAKVLSTPKFGDLVFDGSEFEAPGLNVTLRADQLGSWNTANPLPQKAISLTFRTPNGVYSFHPTNILEKGYVANGAQFYNPNVLKNLDQIYEQGQPISLEGVGWYDDFLKKNDLSTEGILLPAGELNFNVGVGGRWRQYEIGNVSDKIKFNELTGIGKVGDKYVYINNASPVGGADKAYGYYDETGSGYGEWSDERGGLLGSASRAIAKIPFAAEIGGAISGNPYVYATLKGLAGGASGEDPLKVGLQAGATVLAADLASDLLKGSPVEAAPVGGTPGVSEVFPVDMTVGGSVTPLPPMDVGLPSYGLLDGVTFPGQGLRVPGISSPDISLLPPGTALPGQGLVLPTMPGIPGMGGGQGLTLGVPGGTVGAGGFVPGSAVPVLGDPSSFINDPNVLGRDVIGAEPSVISLRDAFDAARGINRAAGLLGGGGGGGVSGGSDPGQMPAGSVDVSNLLALLSGAGVRTPNVYSLLG